MNELLATLRQLRFPKAFRIGPAAPVEEWDALEALLRAAGEAPAEVLSPPFARKLGMLTWLLEQHAQTLPRTDQTEGLLSRIQTVKGALRSQGLEVLDATGEEYDDREVWDKVVGSPEPKGRPVIARMLKPRIVLNGAVLQRGVPVVEDSSESDPTTKSK